MIERRRSREESLFRVAVHLLLIDLPGPMWTTNNFLDTIEYTHSSKRDQE